MIHIEVKCLECGKPVLKYIGEVNRSTRLGRGFFCGRVCSAIFSNRNKKSQEIKRICPECKKEFVTTTRRRSPLFCSRACASRGSMSDYRREAQRKAGVAKAGNLISVSDMMKSREGWKYAALKDRLEKENRKFEFEFCLGKFVFDLALLDSKVLVEFDGPNHENFNQKIIDEEKRKEVEASGFTVVKRSVLPAFVISPDSIEGL